MTTAQISKLLVSRRHPLFAAAVLVALGSANVNAQDIYPGGAAPATDFPPGYFSDLYHTWYSWQTPPASSQVPQTQTSVVQFQGPKRASLGVTLVQQENLAAMIASVESDSPAAVAGLRPGDRILAVGEQPVGNYHDLVRIIGSSSPNAHVQLYVVRNGQPMTVATNLVSPQSLEHPVVQQGRPTPAREPHPLVSRDN